MIVQIIMLKTRIMQKLLGMVAFNFCIFLVFLFNICVETILVDCAFPSRDLYTMRLPVYNALIMIKFHLSSILVFVLTHIHIILT